MFTLGIILVGMISTAYLYFILERRYGFGWAVLGAIVGLLLMCGLLSASSVYSFEGTITKIGGILFFPVIYAVVMIICALIFDKEEPRAE